ncbi:hypothetical protein [Alterisphingorhabdus coralli]|uniref:Phage shock protein B n=1 Tax=Alterisphingorhabdus coralli TaxID=3071408 RepID=A0AA97I1V0_9SPHN|nr:hypothetical protein [Parasphingorhabdus sp. SCSIO 66989]WOE76472.1 hypothetical protein RB602_07095 [Parasphingorhabdus sp. SCSIO 66989]
MNPFEMVIGIVLIVSIAGVLRARYRAQNGILEDEDGNQFRADSGEAKALQTEVKQLKERIAVLERVITDDRGSRELAREIEDLRKD